MTLTSAASSSAGVDAEVPAKFLRTRPVRLSRPADRRRSARRAMSSRVTGTRLIGHSGQLVQIHLVDVSLHGFGGHTSANLSIGDRFIAAAPLGDHDAMEPASFRVVRCETVASDMGRPTIRQIGAERLALAA